METKTVYDIIGIGIGPFNLGMAALVDSVPKLKCLFIDENSSFDWHPGLMLDNARLQVPFYADLVTLADPCSKYSYLAFLKAKKRMFRFAILENNFITRREYNEYCQWVTGQLSSLRFGFRCEAIRYDNLDKVYTVYARDIATGMGFVYHSRNVVIGVGSVPYVPECAKSLILQWPSPKSPSQGGGLDSVGSFADAQDYKKSLIFHSSDYLYFKEQLLTKKRITIVGSGQSAAEIFYDLLTSPGLLRSPRNDEGDFRTLSWFTRNDSFYPMDYSRLSLEKTSPDYIDNFFRLYPEVKKRLLPLQDKFYKGINAFLIDDIYNQLYQQSLSSNSIPVALHGNCELQQVSILVNSAISLGFYHLQLGQDFSAETDALIIATGYRSQIPLFIHPVKERIQWTTDGLYQVNRNYSIDHDNSLFVQNAEIHTHGFVAPDLGMGPYRNAIILNSILGYETFALESGISFQKFGLPA
jgi:lysine N6-hydroxylase